jgi:hypothetical protein
MRVRSLSPWQIEASLYAVPVVSLADHETRSAPA